MKHAPLLLSAVVVLTGACAESAGPLPPPRTYYVDAVVGSDGNAGDSAHPLQTIQRAANVVHPGDVVVVRDGVYTGGSSAVVTIGRGGTAARWVVFEAEHKWGAVLDGQSNASSDAVRVNASYVRIQGFEMRNSQHGVDLAPSAHDVAIAQNHIHDVGRICTGTSGGLSAIYSESSNLLVEQNLIHDTGRLSEGENGCLPGNTNWMNHDHGVYVHGAVNVVIRNNVFYNILHGWAVHMYGGTADQVYIVNNTFAFPNPNRVGHIIIGEPVSNSVIANNIFYQPLTAGLTFDAADGGSTANVGVANNLTSNGLVIDVAAPGITLASNLDNTDPQLVNPSAFDFRLQTGSPAIGAGFSLPYVPDDFDGVSRLGGIAWDIGAFAFR